MKIHLRADSTNAIHTRFTVFINEQNCGQLCMNVDDASLFNQFLRLGCVAHIGTFKSSGVWDLQSPEEKL